MAAAVAQIPAVAQVSAVAQIRSLAWELPSIAKKKKIMVEQNLWSGFLDVSPACPQIASFSD